MDQRLTPYAGTSANRLTEIVNQSNPTGRVVEGVDFEYSKPRPLQNDPEHNTSIDLVALKPGWANVTATYRRLGLSVLEELPEGELKHVVMPHFPVYTHDILASINNALGLSLTEEEVENTRYAAHEPRQPLRVLAIDQSLAWLPGEYFFSAKESNDLEGLIQVVKLDGLYAPKV